MNASDTLTNAPAWLVMWGLAAVLFLIGKTAMLLTPQGRLLTLAGMAAFSLLWVGMDVRPWTLRRKGRGPLRAQEFVPTVLKLTLGMAFIWGAARQFQTPLAQGWCGMIGLVLMLHFGVFELLAMLWRRLGVPVTYIMDRPTAATTLTEFWGRRWNRAFRDLTHPFLFCPVARAWGQGAALWVSFLVSGLAHELVISVPAGGGYGLPALYFLLQALGITLERLCFGRGSSAGKTGRWLFTHAFTLLPAVILFHPPFVERVIIPFLHFLKALP